MQGNVLSPSRHVCRPPAYLILSPSSAVVFVLCRLIYIEKVHVSIRMINTWHSQKANESEEQLQKACTQRRVDVCSKHEWLKFSPAYRHLFPYNTYTYNLSSLLNKVSVGQINTQITCSGPYQPVRTAFTDAGRCLSRIITFYWPLER